MSMDCISGRGVFDPQKKVAWNYIFPSDEQEERDDIEGFCKEAIQLLAKAGATSAVTIQVGAVQGILFCAPPDKLME